MSLRLLPYPRRTLLTILPTHVPSRTPGHQFLLLDARNFCSITNSQSQLLRATTLISICWCNSDSEQQVSLGFEMPARPWGVQAGIWEMVRSPLSAFVEPRFESMIPSTQESQLGKHYLLDSRLVGVEQWPGLHMFWHQAAAHSRDVLPMPQGRQGHVLICGLPLTCGSQWVSSAHGFPRTERPRLRTGTQRHSSQPSPVHPSPFYHWGD